MKGKYRVTVENKKIRYDFEIRRNITIIKGDSATGKTTLVDMIAEYEADAENSGIYLQCEKNCRTLRGRNWESVLTTIHDSIIFIDEGNYFITSKDFANAIQKSDNYFVLVTRDALPMLPYSVEEIYGIRNSGKYGTLKKVYNEMYHIYSDFIPKGEIRPELVIAEDSKSGFQFFQAITKHNEIACISAEGKSNIYDILNTNRDKKILVIADGAAFGPEMEKVMAFLHDEKDCHIYLPESFEWLILKAGVVNDTDIRHILDYTWEYVESSKYVSWERFFTALLTERTTDTYLAYNKSKLNSVYTNGIIKDSILEQMQGFEIK